MTKPRLDARVPILTQHRYSFVAKFDSVTTNNLVARQIVLPDKVVAGRGKGTRLFTPLNAWQGRLISESVNHHKMPLADAAEIARVAFRLAEKGGWIEHWARNLNANRPCLAAYLVVTWTNSCYDAELAGADKAGRPDFSSPKMARFLKQPFIVLPVYHLFEDVWQKCAAMLAKEDTA